MISNHEEELLSPEKVGLPRLSREDLSGGVTVGDSVKIFLNILEGKGSEAQKAVLIANSGMALRKLHPGKSIPECFEIAEISLQGGKAFYALKKLLEL
jgi:anthranilate phosphoribosyltransferase